MLSRIARGLYGLGRLVERSQHVARILEVTHKMNLERPAADGANVWTAIADSFHCDVELPTEAALYDQLVLSRNHEYSVRRCIEVARDEGRAMRDHISEEMWLHLNRTHLETSTLTFERILRIGRSDFNRQIALFCDAFGGLADDTMIRGDSWAFLRIGKLVERASMISRILEIKRKSLELSPGDEGAPVDVHGWQALLRMLSGYEPYRRAYDARIMPERVLGFVLERAEFPRSLACSLSELSDALAKLSSGNPAQMAIVGDVDRMREWLGQVDVEGIVRSGSFEIELREIDRRLDALASSIELGFFTSMRPASVPLTVAPGAGLVPQQ
jgi:uncharacterized alpha-E superfamily protein